MAAPASFERLSLCCHSYIVTDPHSPGRLLGSVLDANNRVTARYDGGFSRVLFEPLCDGCDKVIERGCCLSCERVFVEDRNPANDDGDDPEPGSMALAPVHRVLGGVWAGVIA